MTIEKWKARIGQLRTETYAVYLASKDPRVPWYAKALILFVVAHTFSPIDLIPDFIPVLGYLDDLIITPLGIWIALKMIPTEVLTECRETAQARMDDGKLTRWWAAVVVVLIWLLGLGLVSIWVMRVIEKDSGINP